MSVEIEFAFPSTFECVLVEELPGVPLSGLRYFSDKGRGGRDGVMLRVVPREAESWVGMFAFGSFGGVGISKVLSLPEPDWLCVVARGAGYVVDVSSPASWQVVPAIPIIEARSVLAASVVVVADQTKIIAYGETGLKWRTERLSWDGLKTVAIRDQTLVGEYWDIRTERVATFEVDLLSGASRGGVESE